jgi:hypothetical protein
VQTIAQMAVAAMYVRVPKSLPRMAIQLRRLGFEIIDIVADSALVELRRVLIPAIQQKLIDNDSIFTSKLHDGMDAILTKKTKTEVEFDIGASTVDYSLAVEKGTPPHTPDIDKIYDFVRFKNGVSTPMGGIVVAERVFNSIKTRGTRAHPYILPAFREQRTRVARRITLNMIRRIRTILRPKTA